MSKNTFKNNEAKKLDAILMRMLEEFIEITENEERNPEFSTYRKIREYITKHSESDAQKPKVKEKFKAFRRLWYYLKGAGHLEIKHEDKNDKHKDTFQITNAGLQFVIKGIKP